MATLLDNMKQSLLETRQRYEQLKENGIDAINTFYPGIAINAELYNQLLTSIPKEINRLENKIKIIEEQS